MLNGHTCGALRWAPVVVKDAILSPFYNGHEHQGGPVSNSAGHVMPIVKPLIAFARPIEVKGSTIIYVPKPTD